MMALSVIKTASIEWCASLTFEDNDCFCFFYVKIEILAGNPIRDIHKCLELGGRCSGWWLN